MDWKLVPKVSGSVARREAITLSRDRQGVRLFLPAKVRSQLGDSQYYNLYVQGSRIMLNFTEKLEKDTRKVGKSGYIRLPMRTLGFRLKEGVEKGSLIPEIDKGNLFLDLGKYVELEEEPK